MSSSLAFRFNDGSSLTSGVELLLNTPDCRRDIAGSWLVLGGLGLLSVDGGVGLGMGNDEMLIGSMPSGGERSKVLVGNCFWRSARKSSSGSEENVEGCWDKSQKLSRPPNASISTAEWGVPGEGV